MKKRLGTAGPLKMCVLPQEVARLDIQVLAVVATETQNQFSPEN